MMQRISFFLLFTLSFFMACQDELSPQQKAYQEVMKIHDDVMPKMGKIHRLTKKLKNAFPQDSLSHIDLEWKTERAIRLRQLEDADDAMMDWMAQFDAAKAKNKDGKAALIYLDEERKKISKVSQLMLSSIENSEHFLKKIAEQTENNSPDEN